MFGYIYKITNNINHKFYIGKREKSVFDENYWGSGKHIKNSILKYGINNFSREIVEWCKNREELNNREKYWIEVLNSRDPNIGYNIAAGGDGVGIPHTEEWKIKHSGSGNGRFGKEVSQETRNKISKANKGKKRTKEFKEKVSQSLKGKKKPEGFGQKISVIQKNRKRTKKELENVKNGAKIGAQKRIGKHIYNNGIIEKRFSDDEFIPDNFVRGRLKRIRENCAQHCNLPKNYRWYNNGVVEIYADKCPDSFVAGRLKKHANKVN